MSDPLAELEIECVCGYSGPVFHDWDGEVTRTECPACATVRYLAFRRGSAEGGDR